MKQEANGANSSYNNEGVILEAYACLVADKQYCLSTRPDAYADNVDLLAEISNGCQDWGDSIWCGFDNYVSVLIFPSGGVNIDYGDNRCIVSNSFGCH